MINYCKFSDEDILNFIQELGEAVFDTPVEERLGQFVNAQKIRLDSSVVSDDDLLKKYIEPCKTNNLTFRQQLRRSIIEKREHGFALVEYDKKVDLSINNPIKISYIFVEPTKHGQGIGGKLISEIKEKFPSNTIQIQCVDNEKNIRSKFFEKLGFKIVLREDNNILMEYVPNLVK